MDLKIKTDSLRFKGRANGIILNNGKVLAVKMGHNDFYCLPGGHIHLGENSYDGVLREVEEETGIKPKEAKLVCLIENFFKTKQNQTMHEICFYYLMEMEDLGEKANDFTLVENDEGKLIDMDFRWIDLKDINKYKFKPSFILDKISKGNFDLEHIIIND